MPKIALSFFLSFFFFLIDSVLASTLYNRTSDTYDTVLLTVLQRKPHYYNAIYNTTMILILLQCYIIFFFTLFILQYLQYILYIQNWTYKIALSLDDVVEFPL